MDKNRTRIYNNLIPVYVHDADNYGEDSPAYLTERGEPIYEPTTPMPGKYRNQKFTLHQRE